MDRVDALKGSRTGQIRWGRHFHDRDIVIRTDRRHVWIGKSADVVDHRKPRIDARLGHLVIAGFEGEHCVGGDARDRIGRERQAFEFVVYRERLRAFVRGFEADVDNVRSRLDELINVRGRWPRLRIDTRVIW